MPRPRAIAAALTGLWLLTGLVAAQDVPAPTPAAAKKAGAQARRDRPGTYMGRRIAPVMSYQGADWLVRETRIEEEQPDRMLDALKLRAGDVVADVRAGVGYTSERIARRVGAQGKVLATDVQPEMLALLRRRMAEAGVENVEPILCTQAETGLPDGKVDLAILVDVYHECSQPEVVLRGLRKAIKPGGRLVLVEFRGEDPEVPILPEHKMTLKQVRREVEPQGFAFVESLEFLPWQHVIIFRRPADEPAPAAGVEKK